MVEEEAREDRTHRVHRRHGRHHGGRVRPLEPGLDQYQGDQRHHGQQPRRGTRQQAWDRAGPVHREPVAHFLCIDRCRGVQGAGRGSIGDAGPGSSQHHGHRDGAAPDGDLIAEGKRGPRHGAVPCRNGGCRGAHRDQRDAPHLFPTEPLAEPAHPQHHQQGRSQAHDGDDQGDRSQGQRDHLRQPRQQVQEGGSDPPLSADQCRQEPGNRDRAVHRDGLTFLHRRARVVAHPRDKGEQPA